MFVNTEETIQVILSSGNTQTAHCPQMTLWLAKDAPSTLTNTGSSEALWGLNRVHHYLEICLNFLFFVVLLRWIQSADVTVTWHNKKVHCPKKTSLSFLWGWKQRLLHGYTEKFIIWIQFTWTVNRLKVTLSWSHGFHAVPNSDYTTLNIFLSLFSSC